MMRSRLSLTALLALILFIRSGAPGQTAPPNAPAGFRGDFLSQLTDVEKKFLSLSEAMPAEKYPWRPGEGVRSVGEVYVHVGVDNYVLAGMVGAKGPEGISGEKEKSVTEKTAVRDFVGKSFGFIRDFVAALPDSDLGKPAKFFGRSTTVQGVLFSAAMHMHEHLGQSIAYARMNGIVPPWTAERQARAKEATKPETAPKK